MLYNSIWGCEILVIILSYLTKFLESICELVCHLCASVTVRELFYYLWSVSSLLHLLAFLSLIRSQNGAAKAEELPLTDAYFEPNQAFRMKPCHLGSISVHRRGSNFEELTVMLRVKTNSGETPIVDPEFYLCYVGVKITLASKGSWAIFRRDFTVRISETNRLNIGTYTPL